MVARDDAVKTLKTIEPNVEALVYSLGVLVDLSRIPRQVAHKTQAAWFRVDDLLKLPWSRGMTL